MLKKNHQHLINDDTDEELEEYEEDELEPGARLFNPRVLNKESVYEQGYSSSITLHTFLKGNTRLLSISTPHPIRP